MFFKKNDNMDKDDNLKKNNMSWNDYKNNFLIYPVPVLFKERNNEFILKTKKNKKTIIKKILEDCYSLDRIGLDHGELSNLSKHVIIGRKITIIDFESSSTDRKVSNVTSATQALCIGSGISKIIGRVYKIPKKQKMITVLRRYKREGTRESFENLLSVLKL